MLSWGGGSPLPLSPLTPHVHIQTDGDYTKRVVTPFGTTRLKSRIVQKSNDVYFDLSGNDLYLQSRHRIRTMSRHGTAAIIFPVFPFRYIQAGTELTWDYNYEIGSVPGKVLHCYCGAAECRGRLL